MRHTLYLNGPTLEIWRDNAPLLEIAAASGVMKPAKGGAFIMPDGSRAYRQSGTPALSDSALIDAIARVIHLLNAEDSGAFVVRFYDADGGVHHSEIVEGVNTAADAIAEARDFADAEGVDVSSYEPRAFALLALA